MNGLARNNTKAWLAVLMGLMLSGHVHAGIGYLSRANCIGFVNESVTYDRPSLRPFYGHATSYHTPWGELYPKHVLNTNYGTSGVTWRYYAGDVGDSEQMNVHGVHGWLFVDAGGNPTSEQGAAETDAQDCNLSEW